MSGAIYGATENGAQTLTYVMTYIFGTQGALLLAVVFTLACLTTCVGLITSCGQYFASLTPKMSYKVWATVLAFASFTLANMGLNQILSFQFQVKCDLSSGDYVNRFSDEIDLLMKVV